MTINTQFIDSAERPISLYERDFIKTGRSQFPLFYYIHGESWPYSSRNEIVDEFPGLKKTFLYHREYATAHLNTKFTSEQLEVVQELKAKQLNNCRLENLAGIIISKKNNSVQVIKYK